MKRAISLKCPDCQANLSGENTSTVFLCHTCAFCFNVGAEKLNKYPLVYIKPKVERKEEQVYFPFWQIESEFTMKSHTGIRLFHIPAFFIKNINNFGDIGYYYLQKNVTLEPGNRKDLEALPADRDIKRAAQYPYIYLCKENNETGISLKHKSASMALVPFYKTGTHYFDSILSWKYPLGAVN
ncbi:MAG: hypothetical protein GY950_21645 [bacterium]|nr:hypothetical protein [bacterium]